jgi:hypothetical protein
MEWAKATLNALEKSGNIVMHGGSVAKEDVERIGMTSETGFDRQADIRMQPTRRASHVGARLIRRR